MTTKSVLIRTVLAAALFCSLTLAQAPAPVQNIDPTSHPNLAAAQGLIAQAFNKIQAARQDNDFDMQGHAAKAQSLLDQASKELKLSAEMANQNAQKKK